MRMKILFVIYIGINYALSGGTDLNSEISFLLETRIQNIIILYR